MNRKLIRPTLAEVKSREAPPLLPPAPRERSGSSDLPSRSNSPSSSSSQYRGTQQPAAGGNGPATQGGRKRVPVTETNAEIFYYKKQMDSHTPMVIVLQDGEEIEGTIEWYDRSALKINRRSAPNILLLKHNIKYMYKAEDREAK